MKFLKQNRLKFMQRSLIKKVKVSTKLSTKFYLSLIALESKIISSNELQTLYQTINKLIKKQNTLDFNIFIHLNWTKKPTEVRMGKGKGRINSEVGKIQKGFSILNLITTNLKQGKIALKCCKLKLSIKSTIRSNKFIFLL